MNRLTLEFKTEGGKLQPIEEIKLDAALAMTNVLAEHFRWYASGILVENDEGQQEVATDLVSALTPALAAE